MRIDAEVHGSDPWERALAHKLQAVDRATWRATAEAAHLIERDVKLTLRTYTHPRGEPTTSPPGQPPALVTGNLARSVIVRGPRSGRGRYQVVAHIGPTAVYSRIQELGGRAGRKHRSRLPKRPYVKPTVRRLRKEVRRIYQRHWTRALLS
jgi:phage gpG-like protein